MKKIDKFKNNYKKWVLNTPFVSESIPLYDNKRRQNFGSIRIDLKRDDVAIVESRATSMDSDKTMYLPMNVAEKVYNFLKDFFEEEGSEKQENTDFSS